MYKFIDNKGTFKIKNPQYTSNLYFPIANESGMKSCVTPLLRGDSKLDQNTFLLEPVSSYDLNNNKSSRNFWAKFDTSVVSLCKTSASDSANLFKNNISINKKISNDDKDNNMDDTVLTAGIMWHKVENYFSEQGVKSQILSFVPVNEDKSLEFNVEIMMVTVTNIGDNECSFVPTAAIPMYSRSADNLRDHRHVSSLLNRITTIPMGVVNKPTLTFDERGHKINNLSYYVLGCEEDGRKPVSFYPTVDMFIGEGGSFENPRTLYEDTLGVNEGFCIDGYEAMGALSFRKVTLKPNEERTYIVMMGIDDDSINENIFEKIFVYYNSKEKVLHALKKIQEYWDKQINIEYQSGDTNFNNYMHWVSFQPMLRRIYGCSFLPHHDYGKGGRGWRDLWQDCLALLLMDPVNVNRMLINNYKGVRIDGTNATIIGSKEGEFVADRNNIVRVWCDHGVWPLITTKLYLDQTGDIDILFENVEYFRDKQIYRADKIDETFKEGDITVLLDKDGNIYKGSILEHIIIQNISAFYDTGIHGFLKLRGADWNDALDMADKNGESVAFTAAYVNNLNTIVDILTFLKDNKNMDSIDMACEVKYLLHPDSDSLKKYFLNVSPYVSGEKVKFDIDKLINCIKNMSNILSQRIKDTQWVDGWYNGYYDDNCNMVEGIFDSNARIMLTSQVFTVMSKIASKDQVIDIIKNCDKYLYKEEKGGYRLNSNFHEVKSDLGRMFGFAYGHKENGAVFSHMTVMYANALYKRGFVKEGYKAINTLYKQSTNFEVSKIYPGIPEYFDIEGRGMYHYLTGAASWYMMTVVNEMFGVKGLWGNLCLEPKLLKEQFDKDGKASITLTFARKKIKVCYINISYVDYDDAFILKVVVEGKEKICEDNTKLVIIDRTDIVNSDKDVIDICVYFK